MKNLFRRLFGRMYQAQYSKKISYIGSWKKDNFHGLGQMKYANGTTFTSSFKNGAKNGLGHIKYTNGFQYNGDWVTGYQTGFGKISYKNGGLYEGGIQNGLRHREGRLFKASDCTWYEGSWNHGTLYGHVIISSSDWIFEGQLPEVNEVSNIKLTYPDGSSYVGQFSTSKDLAKVR